MSTAEVVVAGDAAARAACFAIRTAVFVDEQGVRSDEEFDEHEAGATHLLARIDGRAVGTLRWRVLPSDTAKIERVAVLREVRGQGVGLLLVEAAVRQLAAAGIRSAVLNAQTTAAAFYGRLGFAVSGELFDEAGIPHVPMRLDDLGSKHR